MAVRPVPKKYTFTSSGGDTLAGILGVTKNTWVGSVVIRAGRNNAADVYWTDLSGELGGYIGATEAVVFDYGPGQALLSEFKLVGTAGDVVYMTICVNQQ